MLREFFSQFVLWSRIKPWPEGLTQEQRRDELWKISHLCRGMRNYDYHFWTITYKDGHKELAWLKYRRGLVWRRILFSYPFRPYGVKSIDVF